MTWAKIDDNFPQHPKAVLVGPLGRDLYVCGLCYVKRCRTDGVIPSHLLKHIAPGLATPGKIARQLVEAGLWEAIDGGGYRIHDYHDWNDPAEVVQRRQEEKRERQNRWLKKGRAVLAERRDGDASIARLGDASIARLTEKVETLHRDRDRDRDQIEEAGGFTVEDSAGGVAGGLGRPEGPPAAPAAGVVGEAGSIRGRALDGAPETAGEVARRAVLRLQAAALLRGEGER